MLEIVSTLVTQPKMVLLLGPEYALRAPEPLSFPVLDVKDEALALGKQMYWEMVQRRAQSRQALARCLGLEF